METRGVINPFISIELIYIPTNVSKSLNYEPICGVTSRYGFAEYVSLVFSRENLEKAQGVCFNTCSRGGLLFLGIIKSLHGQVLSQLNT